MPYNNIYFKDIRLDTSCTAIQVNPKSKLEKITLNDFSTSLQNHFRSSGLYSFNQEKNSLVCFVKKMRFSDLDSSSKDYVNGRNSLNTKDILNVEGFLKVDSLFYPAIKLDTTFIAHIEVSVEGRQHLLTQILYDFALKASRIKEEAIMKRHAYSFIELEDRYAKRKELPILKDTVLTAGLYLSFSEFINNKPSIKNFEISDGYQKVVTIKNDDGSSEVIRNVFGFSDGKFAWVQANNNFFPVFKHGTSLHFWTTAIVKKKPLTYIDFNGLIYSSSITMGALAINSLSKPETDYIFPHNLDIETGDIY